MACGSNQERLRPSLRTHPEVRDTVVVAREEPGGEKRLVAYLVTQGESSPTIAALRTFLQEKLPDYMVPVAFVTLMPCH